MVTRIQNHCRPLPAGQFRAHNQPNHTGDRGKAMEKHRLARIEQYIVEFFQLRQQTRILAKDLFDSTHEYANADLVRALEDLEKKKRLLVRHTYEGNDYVSLTAQGTEIVGLEQSPLESDATAMPHPPKSATPI
jgi:hypothetical protein